MREVRVSSPYDHDRVIVIVGIVDDADDDDIEEVDGSVRITSTNRLGNTYTSLSTLSIPTYSYSHHHHDNNSSSEYAE